jgi:hypothetical protein
MRAAILAWVEDAGLQKAGWEVTGDGGEVYGSVRWNAGRTSARVADPAALLAYVQERYPTEVRDVPTIQERFLADLLKRVGDGTYPGGPPPGVTVVEGDPFLTITPSDAAKKQARDVLEGQGRPTLPGLPGSQG